MHFPYIGLEKKSRLLLSLLTFPFYPNPVLLVLNHQAAANTPPTRKTRLEERKQKANRQGSPPASAELEPEPWFSATEHGGSQDERRWFQTGKTREAYAGDSSLGKAHGTPLLLAKGSSSPVSRASSTDLFLIPCFAFLTQHFTSFCGILTQGHTSLVSVCPHQHLGLLHLPCLPVLAAVSRVLLIRSFQTPPAFLM